MTTFTLGLLINLPIIVAVIATTIAWRSIKQRLLFLLAATLSLLGLQSLVAPVSIGIFLPHGGGLAQAVVLDAFNQSIIVASIAILIFGVPYVWWLRYAFRKP